ncbi:MAG: tRNA dihydrouridine(20/20a) synthase DusA [Myxococcota bacterium]
MTVQAPPHTAPARDDVRGVVRPLSVAPMMDRTDRHFRALMRRITRHTLLYTEMLTTGAILFGDRDHLLGYDPMERPLAFQAGGEDPEALAAAARIVEDLGYDEIDLNIGCPSDRVQSGAFGAALMTRPERVAECVATMRAAVRIPVTVKHRIGVDDLDRYEDMARFVETVSAAGADRFTVHARKAWLQGLSPKDNRNVPPLRYEDVYRLKRDFPHLVVEINGGVRSLDEVREHLRRVDAVMIGRAAWDTPWMFAEADRRIFADAHPLPTRHGVVEAMLPYAQAWVEAGGRLHHVTKPMLHLFRGCPGAKAWRRHIAENAHRDGADARVLEEALARVPREAATTDTEVGDAPRPGG